MYDMKYFNYISRIRISKTLLVVKQCEHQNVAKYINWIKNCYQHFGIQYFDGIEDIFIQKDCPYLRKNHKVTKSLGNLILLTFVFQTCINSLLHFHRSFQSQTFFGLLITAIKPSKSSNIFKLSAIHKM